MTKGTGLFNPLLPLLAGVCGWLVPGGGYMLIGEWKRGVVVAVCITGLFLTGLYIGSVAVVDPVYETLYYYTQILASPLVFVVDHISQNMGANTPAKRMLVFARPNEIGQIYTSVAGMLNLLCILSAIAMADAKVRQGRGQ
jgi:hypothetical protein